MDRFYVELTHPAEKEYARLDEKLKTRIKEAIEALSLHPTPVKEFDVTKLGGKNSEYRIRIQTHRIKYRVDWKNKKVIVYEIGRKKDRTYK